jgi:monofunctional biosynthetic peptidoglycan transglycosylase
VRIRQLRLWATRLLRFAVACLLGYGAWLAVMIPLYRFVNPPLSALMAVRALGGQTLKQTWRPLEQVSPSLIEAVLISEDGQFCEHWGVDWDAMAFALQHQGLGASTITMQTVKNLFLWNSRTVLRKLPELPLAYAANLIWGKRRTLEIYLNIAEWGPGIFGIEEAAQRAFHKGADALSPSEAALLAAALPNPIKRNAGKANARTRTLAGRVRRQFGASQELTDCVGLSP